jgi:predicted nucleic acid-binding protein
MRFVDTNVLLYAIGAEADHPDKTERALGLLTQRDLALSTQVLQEFYVQATRSGRRGALTHSEAVAFVTAMQRLHVQEVHDRGHARGVRAP